MHRTRRFSTIALGISLTTLCVLFSLATPRGPRRSLDEESTLLSILRTDSGFSLQWFPVDTLHYWCVTFSREQSMDDLDTLAITTDTFFVYNDLEGLYDLGFFRVDPIDIVPPPPSTDVIQSFDEVPILFSVAGEDSDPGAFSVDSTDYFGTSGQSLRMFGNTWKRNVISPRHVDSTSVWAVAMKLNRLGEIHAFGVADSANYMYYVVWGREAPQSLYYITTYEGYFGDSAWVDIEFPIGEDWQGRFGYQPNITELRFVNDNDTVAIDGEALFDAVRDVSHAQPLNPETSFLWSVIDRSNPDSIRVAFHSFAYDLDSPVLDHWWNFGDGTTTSELHPVHTFPTHSRFPVTLSVTDDQERTSWFAETLVDTPVTTTRDMWFAFTGDVILGRGYENGGGIIETWGVDTIFEPTLSWIQAADLTSMNLECPLTTASERHPTKGIVFKSRPQNVSGLVNAGIDFVTLANNHVYDYLEAGMNETMYVLDSVGIVNNGSGMDDEQARKLKILSSSGISFGMLSFSDRTGSYNNYQPFLDAGRSRAGFAMWNRGAIDATIEEARQLTDFVIVNTHSGSEYSLAPILGMQYEYDPDGDEDMILELIPDTLERQMRHYAIDMGAEMVIAHHPHIIQGFEVYSGKLIAHSLGNFVFDLTYAETMPSVILRTHVNGDTGVDQAIVVPVYINHWIPQPARGELARNILDYETEMSRRLDTWLIRQPGADSAFIVFDTTQVQHFEVAFTDTLPVFAQGSFWQSLPMKLDPTGYVVSGAISNAADCQVRFGREALYFGNMENEGANDWQLNSGDEGYALDTVHSGTRSIRLRRVSGNPNNVVANIENRMLIQPGQNYSMYGWMKTSNALAAGYQIQYYGGRSGGTPLGQVDIGPLMSGTFDWTLKHDELALPGGTYFLLIRMTLNAPAAGTGYAWFDDASLIQWDGWTNAPASLPFPNDYHYVQVRSATNIGEAEFEYHNQWVEPAPVEVTFRTQP